MYVIRILIVTEADDDDEMKLHLLPKFFDIKNNASHYLSYKAKLDFGQKCSVRFSVPVFFYHTEHSIYLCKAQQ